MGARSLVVGEALVDIVKESSGETREHVGGSPLNVAVGLARLDHRVTLATHFGRDAHGAAIGEHLAEAGVDLVPGSDRAADTSVATATLDESGAATYDFDIDWRLPALPQVPGHVHTGSIGALLRPGCVDVLSAMSGAARTHTVSYDPNCRPQLMGDPAQETTQVGFEGALYLQHPEPGQVIEVKHIEKLSGCPRSFSV